MDSTTQVSKIAYEFRNRYLEDGQPNWEFSRQQPDWPEYVRDELNHPFTRFLPVSLDENGNATNNFSQGDSEIQWKRKRRHLGKDWHYFSKKIHYKRNASGFRTYEWHEINWKECIVLLGCSCTYGVGVDDSETIAEQLEALCGRQVVNLGLGGTSNQFMAFVLTKLYNRFDSPYAVVANYTTVDRNLYFHESDLFHLGPWAVNHKDKLPSDSLYPVRQKDLYFNNFYNPTNAMMQTRAYSDTIRALCKDRSKLLNITFFEDAAHAVRADKFFPIDNEARDCAHPGRDRYKEIAEWINERL